jgi:hypothetical protein
LNDLSWKKISFSSLSFTFKADISFLSLVHLLYALAYNFHLAVSKQFPKL